MRKRNWATSVVVVSAFVAVSASVARADAGVGSDCAVLGPVASNAIPTLAPLQNLPESQAAPRLDAYIGSLRAQEGKLSTAKGKADLQAYIDALQNANSSSAAPQIYAAITRLQTDCPT
jgi:hypothetical protein